MWSHNSSDPQVEVIYDEGNALGTATDRKHNFGLYTRKLHRFILIMQRYKICGYANDVALGMIMLV